MATSDVYSCTYNYLERSESLPDHDGIFPINFDVVKCCSTRRQALCKCVRDILKDPIFSNEVLHNVKSIKRTYTNAGVAQALLSNFEPSYRSQSKMRQKDIGKRNQIIENNYNLHDIRNIKRTHTNAGVAQAMLSNFDPSSRQSHRSSCKIRHNDSIQTNQDVKRYSNWCFSINFDGIMDNSRTKGQSTVNMINIFDKSANDSASSFFMPWCPWVQKFDPEDFEKSCTTISYTVKVPIPEPDKARHNVPRRASAA